MSKVNIIGAGLAGCEAAYQLAKRNIKVNLYDCKPNLKTPAHKSDDLCELICSNSFKADRISSAAGLLKEEMRILDSLLLKIADECRVPAGGALAVDRQLFSRKVTEYIKNLDNITYISKEVESFDDDEITIISSGPLTLDKLSSFIQNKYGPCLSFFDAVAPIVDFESIDMNNAFYQSRYDRGDKEDYINCPLNKEEYELFYNELISAERAPVHDFDVMNPKVYEGCMPVEVMAQRGIDTLRFGPMKPVGLTDPKTNHRPWACLQLRKENVNASMFNLVGFQTNLKFPEQQRVFSYIPALKNAEYFRYGVMHRNTFLNSPKLLTEYFSVKSNRNIFFAGQITGVEGYMESAASGIISAINVFSLIKNIKQIKFPDTTIIGSFQRYISTENINFQPMGANFGILPSLENRPRDKKLRGEEYAKRSLNDLNNYIKEKMYEHNC